MVNTFIGLGSNLDQPEQQVRRALQWLGNLPETTLVRHSSLYQTAPIGPQDQPDFINAVAWLETQLDAITLLDELQALEQKAGRIRRRHWGERTLDLDILLYGDAVIDIERLTLPHREITRRAFVLIPLIEIAPTLMLPDGTPVSTCLATTDSSQVTRIRS